MSGNNFYKGDRVRHDDGREGVVVVGAVPRSCVAWDGTANGTWHSVGHLTRLAPTPGASGDTLRTHAEEMMRTRVEGLQCRRLFDALSAYVDNYPGSDVTGRTGAELVETSTGGGCTAWEATLFANETQSVLLRVTDENLSHPCNDTFPVSMGLYLRDEENEEVRNRWVVFDTVAEALAAVQRGFTGVVWTEGEG